MYDTKKTQFTLWCIVAIIVLVGSSKILLPRLFEYSGKLMNPLQTFGEFKYAYSDSFGNEEGLYRSKKNEKKYIKVTEYYTKSGDQMFAVDDIIYFADVSGCIVKLDSKTGKVTRKINGTNYFELLAANKKHLIVFEVDSNILFSILTSDLEIEKEIGKHIPEKLEISDEGVDFSDKLTRTKYHYSFETYEVIKVNP